MSVYPLWCFLEVVMMGLALRLTSTFWYVVFTLLAFGIMPTFRG